MKISLIVAMAENRVIGRDNQLPWRLSDDLKRFKAITMGHPLIMGRKTFESLGRPLPGRLNIVLSRSDRSAAAGVVVAASLEEALREAGKAAGSEEVFVVGGAEVYRQALPLADRLYLTLVHEEVEGDATFPQFAAQEFDETSREPHEGSPSFTYLILDRKKKSSS